MKKLDRKMVSKVLKNQELDYTQNFLLLNANRREKNFIRCIKACELLREVYNINPMINYTSNKKITNTVGMKHLGYLSPEDLEKYIDNSILLFPSLSEGYGIEAKRSENIRILSGSLTMSWEHNIEPRTIFVDANSVVEIAAAIYLCMNNQYCNKLSVEYSDPVQTIIGLLDEDI